MSCRAARPAALTCSAPIQGWLNLAAPPPRAPLRSAQGYRSAAPVGLERLTQGVSHDASNDERRSHGE